MGTKNNPGKFDCYEKAELDEPIFTLLGRDPKAAGMVKIWAYLTYGEPIAAMEIFCQLAQQSTFIYNEVASEKKAEAISCSEQMAIWFLEH